MVLSVMNGSRRFFEMMEIRLEIEDLAAALIAEEAAKESRTGAAPCGRSSPTSSTRSNTTRGRGLETTGAARRTVVVPRERGGY